MTGVEDLRHKGGVELLADVADVLRLDKDVGSKQLGIADRVSSSLKRVSLQNGATNRRIQATQHDAVYLRVLGVEKIQR